MLGTQRGCWGFCEEGGEDGLGARMVSDTRIISDTRIVSAEDGRRHEDGKGRGWSASRMISH